MHYLAVIPAQRHGNVELDESDRSRVFLQPGRVALGVAEFRGNDDVAGPIRTDRVKSEPIRFRPLCRHRLGRSQSANRTYRR